MNSSDRRRVSVQFSPKEYKNLQSLCKRSNTSKKTEVMRKALLTYEAFLAAQSRGQTIILRDSNGKEIDLKILV